MTNFERTLVRRLSIINNTEIYPHTAKFSVEDICDVVVDTLLDLGITFFEDGEEVTEYVLPKQLRDGDKFYWVTINRHIDEYTLSKVVYRKSENGHDFPFEVFVHDGDDEYSVGWIDYNAFGNYIFTDKEDAGRKATRL